MTGLDARRRYILHFQKPVLITTWYSFEAVLKITLHMPDLFESNRIYRGKIQSRWRHFHPAHGPADRGL